MPDQIDKNKEIEARFLVCRDKWRGTGTPVKIYQGYLSTDKDRVIRIRIKGDDSVLTIKGSTDGMTKTEYEFMLDDVNKAKEVIQSFCSHPIEKIRHTIKHGDFVWEVDEYGGENEGLVIAEVEFAQEKDFDTMMKQGKPEWVGKNITVGHWEYTNMRLAERPFAHWSNEEKKNMLQHASGNASGCR
jgi:CYTH domain-containing protein